MSKGTKILQTMYVLQRKNIIYVLQRKNPPMSQLTIHCGNNLNNVNLCFAEEKC